MTPDDIIAVLSAGIGHADKATECPTCAPKHTAIEAVQRLAAERADAGRILCDTVDELTRAHEAEIAALRADVERFADSIGMVATDDTGYVRQVASLKEITAYARDLQADADDLAALRGLLDQHRPDEFEWESDEETVGRLAAERAEEQRAHASLAIEADRLRALTEQLVLYVRRAARGCDPREREAIETDLARELRDAGMEVSHG